MSYLGILGAGVLEGILGAEGYFITAGSYRYPPVRDMISALPPNFKILVVLGPSVVLVDLLHTCWRCVM